MSNTAKFFLGMIIFVLIVGAIVLKLFPDYNVDEILKSNFDYYPSVTDSTIKK